LHVPPGAYALELLADGRHVHSMLVQSKTVTAAAGRTATADFRFDVP
jgi:hypothetical protein